MKSSSKIFSCFRACKSSEPPECSQSSAWPAAAQISFEPPEGNQSSACPAAQSYKPIQLNRSSAYPATQSWRPTLPMILEDASVSSWSIETTESVPTNTISHSREKLSRSVGMRLDNVPKLDGDHEEGLLHRRPSFIAMAYATFS